MMPYYIVPQVAFQPLFHYLGLSIGLGVITSAWSQISPHQLEKFFPKATHEAVVPITHYGPWDTMESKYISKEELNYL